MGRIRTIKPEFWEDDRVGQLSPLARLVFIGSWNLADDAGRLRWSADYINASLFMYDRLTTKKVAGLMGEVEAQELVVPYEARGQQLAFVPGWAHQRIDKPQPPRFPPPPGVEDGNDSGNDSGNDDGNAPRQEGKGREGIREGKGIAPADAGDFEAFWSAYPRKTDRKAAAAAWPKATKKAPAAELVAAAIRYAADPNREDAFTLHPTTWLNRERWNDPPLPPRTNGRESVGDQSVRLLLGRQEARRAMAGRELNP